MGVKKIRQYHPAFKFRVVLESFVKGNVAGVARKYGINANQLSSWRRQLIDKGSLVFQSGKTNREKQLEKS